LTIRVSYALTSLHGTRRRAPGRVCTGSFRSSRKAMSRRTLFFFGVTARIGPAARPRGRARGTPSRCRPRSGTRQSHRNSFHSGQHESSHQRGARVLGACRLDDGDAPPPVRRRGQPGGPARCDGEDINCPGECVEIRGTTIIGMTSSGSAGSKWGARRCAVLCSTASNCTVLRCTAPAFSQVMAFAQVRGGAASLFTPRYRRLSMSNRSP
jgi:hypothetical protein